MKEIKRVSIRLYIDYQNVRLTQSEINYLLDYARAKGNLIHARIYYNSQIQNQSKLLKCFKDCNLDYVDVPCPLKNSADNQLVADCVRDISTCLPDAFIIVSGDGDFLDLVQLVRKLNSQAFIVARKGNVNQKLIKSANEFCFIDQLPNQICADRHDLPKIDYEDAVQCLLEAVNAAITSGKRPCFPLIDQLMRKNRNFSSYQGVSSIEGRNKRGFASFKKFAESIVRDGLISIKTQGNAQEIQLSKANLLAA
jgi:uncharacterized LabA/DUF88 family protein